MDAIQPLEPVELELELAQQMPSNPKLLITDLASCIANFCVALDKMIIATAIPHITDQF